MDEEVLDSPLDLSIPRSDVALLSNVGGLQSNNSFSWSGMAEALSWSDQLLRVKSVMTIAQLNQDWKDEEEVQEEDDQQPWRFDGQFEAFKPLEEEVEDVVGEEGVTIAESRSLEVGQEFHIFGGEEERSPVATKQFRERAEDIGKPGLRAIPPSDDVAGEESSPVCLCNFMEVLGEEDHVEMGDENLNNEAPLKRGSGGVQELLDSWEDWESGAASVSLEVPWRAVESERFGGFDFPKVDSMLVTDDGDKTALVMSHDGEESEHMTSELDPSSLLNCMELTLFGGEGQLKRGSSRSPGLRN